MNTLQGIDNKYSLILQKFTSLFFLRTIQLEKLLCGCFFTFEECSLQLLLNKMLNKIEPWFLLIIRP